MVAGNAGIACELLASSGLLTKSQLRELIMYKLLFVGDDRKSFAGRDNQENANKQSKQKSDQPVIETLEIPGKPILKSQRNSITSADSDETDRLSRNVHSLLPSQCSIDPHPLKLDQSQRSQPCPSTYHLFPLRLFLGQP